ncbi:MAG: hypothetical protein QM811_18370 [Pirellulales bacterium]
MRKRFIGLCAFVLPALCLGGSLVAQTLPKPYVEYGNGPNGDGPAGPDGGAACACNNPGGVTFTAVAPQFAPNNLSAPNGPATGVGFGATNPAFAGANATQAGGAAAAPSVANGTVTRAGMVENKWLGDGQLMSQCAPPRVDTVFLSEDCRCVDPDFCPKPPPAFPPISVELDVLAMRRTQPDYAILNDTLGFTQTGVNDIDFAAGPRVRVDLRGIDQYDVEGVFYRIDSWDGSETYTTGVGAGTGRADFDSKLFSGELNLRRTWPERQWLTGMVGMRYLEETDRIFYNSPIPVGNTFSSLTGRNKLYGGHVGLDVLLWQPTETFAISAFGKGGVFFNTAAHVRTTRLANGTLVNAVDNFDPTSFLGETALAATYRPHRQIAIRAGYQYLVIAGLAQPSDAIVFNQADHTITYHGGFIGFELSW